MNEDWREIAAMLNACEYLDLCNLTGLEDLKLTLTIKEARVQNDLVNLLDRPVDLPFLADARPIESDRLCRVFEIVYDDPTSVTMVNESYGRYPEAPERFDGRNVRIFSWSYLLDLTRKATYASDEYPGPGPLQHHSIVCLNHVIDVITTKDPTGRVLSEPLGNL